MEIRTMLPEDLSQVAALEAACFGSDAWSEQALEQAPSDKNALYLSCMEEGRLIACCGIWQSFEDGDITNVAVEEGSRRKGCARRLLLELMRRASFAAWKILRWRSGKAISLRSGYMNPWALL